MTDWIEIESDPKHISREKIKARKLRKTQWWKNRINRGICHYCHKKFDPKDLTMDHIVPLSRGGKSAKGNVAPCCMKCNSKKKYHTPVEILLEKMDHNSSDNSNDNS